MLRNRPTLLPTACAFIKRGKGCASLRRRRAGYRLSPHSQKIFATPKIFAENRKMTEKLTPEENTAKQGSIAQPKADIPRRHDRKTLTGCRKLQRLLEYLEDLEKSKFLAKHASSAGDMGLSQISRFDFVHKVEF